MAGYEQYQSWLLEVPLTSAEYAEASSDDLSSEWDSDAPDGQTTADIHTHKFRPYADSIRASAPLKHTLCPDDETPVHSHATSETGMLMLIPLRSHRLTAGPKTLTSDPSVNAWNMTSSEWCIEDRWKGFGLEGLSSDNIRLSGWVPAGSIPYAHVDAFKSRVWIPCHSLVNVQAKVADTAGGKD
ncbi:hypothetical protein AAG570_011349 [Ranatra chinensis]|uniref:Uncharacterized protein n=1 Tax=Ranatra chinensis TaxID=642074 RepID=A0ABD0YKN9_9HEMI